MRQLLPLAPPEMLFLSVREEHVAVFHGILRQISFQSALRLAVQASFCHRLFCLLRERASCIRVGQALRGEAVMTLVRNEPSLSVSRCTLLRECPLRIVPSHSVGVGLDN